MVIRGYGVYSYNRDIHEMAKKLAILEKSCRLLMLDGDNKDYDLDWQIRRTKLAFFTTSFNI